MLFGTRGFVASAFLLMSAHALAGAVSIQYNLVPQGGNVYKYVYSVTNPAGGSAAVQDFYILFDSSLYQLNAATAIVSPAFIQSQWAQQILGPVPGLQPAYDAFAIFGGIPVGGTVTGFSVQFTWLGSGTPGAQPFQIYNPTTFALLQSGNTVLSPTPLAVPAASTLSLVLIGCSLTFSLAYLVSMQNRQMAAISSRSPEL